MWTHKTPGLLTVNEQIAVIIENAVAIKTINENMPITDHLSLQITANLLNFRKILPQLELLITLDEDTARTVFNTIIEKQWKLVRGTSLDFLHSPDNIVNHCLTEISRILYPSLTAEERFRKLAPGIKQQITIDVSLPDYTLSEMAGKKRKRPSLSDVEFHLVPHLLCESDVNMSDKTNEMVVINDAVFLVTDLHAYLSRQFESAHRFYQQLKKQRPDLIKKINQEFLYLRDIFEILEQKKITPREALVQLIQGLKISGSTYSGKDAATNSAEAAIAKFQTYLEVLPAQMQNQVLDLNAGRNTVKYILQQHLIADGACVETAAGNLKMIVGNPANDRVLDQIIEENSNSNNRSRYHKKIEQLHCADFNKRIETVSLPGSLIKETISSINIAHRDAFLALLNGLDEEYYQYIPLGKMNQFIRSHSDFVYFYCQLPSERAAALTAIIGPRIFIKIITLKYLKEVMSNEQMFTIIRVLQSSILKSVSDIVELFKMFNLETSRNVFSVISGQCYEMITTAEDLILISKVLPVDLFEQILKAKFELLLSLDVSALIPVVPLLNDEQFVRIFTKLESEGGFGVDSTTLIPLVRAVVPGVKPFIMAKLVDHLLEPLILIDDLICIIGLCEKKLKLDLLERNKLLLNDLDSMTAICGLFSACYPDHDLILPLIKEVIPRLISGCTIPEICMFLNTLPTTEIEKYYSDLKARLSLLKPHDIHMVFPYVGQQWRVLVINSITSIMDAENILRSLPSDKDRAELMQLIEIYCPQYKHARVPSNNLGFDFANRFDFLEPIPSPPRLQRQQALEVEPLQDLNFLMHNNLAEPEPLDDRILFARQAFAGRNANNPVRNNPAAEQPAPVNLPGNVRPRLG